jgi:hypothetical protein
MSENDKQLSARERLEQLKTQRAGKSNDELAQVAAQVKIQNEQQAADAEAVSAAAPGDASAVSNAQMLAAMQRRIAELTRDNAELAARQSAAEKEEEAARRAAMSREATYDEEGNVVVRKEPMLKTEDGRELWGVYVLTNGGNMTVLVKNKRNQTVHLQFTNGALFVYSQEQFQLMEENMEKGSSFKAIMMRATPGEAAALLRIQAEVQKPTATSGAMATPVLRVAELITANTLALAKGNIAAGRGVTAGLLQ